MTTSEDNCLFKNYILTGHGIGLKIVTLMALLISLFTGIVGPIILTEIFNDKELTEIFSNNMPVIKIQNGKIVDPVYNNAVWTSSNITGDPQNEVIIVANTTVDSVSEIPENVTAYITARNIYTRNKTDIRVYHIPDDLTTTITHEKMASLAKKLLWAVGFVLALFLFVSAIIGFLIGYIPLIIVGLIVNRKLAIDAWGRAFAWPWIIIWGIAILAGMFGIFYLSTLYVYLISLLITWIIGASLYNRTNTCSFENASVLADETNSVETKSEVISKEEIPTEPVIEKTTASIQKEAKSSAPVVRKASNTRTKKAVVKPKNVPVQRKSKKK